MKPLRVGAHRQRVTLSDVPETTRDSYGQPSQTASTIGTFWGEVRPLRGSEMLNVRTMWATASHVVTLRWLGSAIPATPGNPDRLILPRMRFTLTKGAGDRVLNILAAQNVEERNRSWVCYCEEKVLN